jgi:hypothetical protein
VFDRHRNNLKKIGAHRVKVEGVEQALAHDPILVYEQDADGEERYVLPSSWRDGEIRVFTAYDLDARQSATIWNRAREENKPVSKATPKFKNEDEEATWWASRKGRGFLKRHSAAPASKSQKGSPLVAKLNRANGVQIALRLPAPDIAKARRES